MKTSTFLVFSAIFLGVGLFGMSKSLTLLKKNVDLAQATAKLTVDLDATQVYLKQARSALSDSYLKNAELEGDLKGLETKLAKKEEEARAYLVKFDEASQALKEATAASESLAQANIELKQQALRSELEYSEMRKKLSSIQELKLAIRELKIKMRQERRKKGPAPVTPKKSKQEVVVQTIQAAVPQPQAKEEEKATQKNGNEGFFIKYGKSTFEDLVDIKVVPADTAPMGLIESQER